MAVDVERVRAAVSEILIAIGEDVDRDGLVNTPNRVANMYEELFSGLHDDPARHLEVTFAAEHDEMVMVRDIPFASLCEHHLVPFLGKAHVAYIPAEDGRITGLSKLARLVDGYSRRPQVQERRRHPHQPRREIRLHPRLRFGYPRQRPQRGQFRLHARGACLNAAVLHQILAIGEADEAAAHLRRQVRLPRLRFALPIAMPARQLP